MNQPTSFLRPLVKSLGFVSWALGLCCLPAHAQPKAKLPTLPKSDPRALAFLSAAAKSHLRIQQAYIEDIGQGTFAGKPITYKISLWFKRPSQFRIENRHAQLSRYISDSKSCFIDEPGVGKYQGPRTVSLAGKLADDAIKAVCKRNGLVMLYLLQGVTEFADFKPKPGDKLGMVAIFLPDATVNGHLCRRVSVEKIFRNSNVGIEPVYIRNVAWFDKKTLNLQAFETTGRGPHVNMHSRDILTYHISAKPPPADTFKIPTK